LKEIDFLFIHPSTHYRLKGSKIEDLVTFITMPLGTIALADLLDRNGYSTLIYHTGIEQMYDRGFRVEDLFGRYDLSVVGIDLHWFVHSYDAIRIARIVKQCSDAFVVFGGFTASYYGNEIMSQFRCVDAIITGDAEVPLLEFMRKRTKEELDEVPNLIYRDGDSIRSNEKKFIADEESLKQLDYTNFKLLWNHDKYHRAITQSGDLDVYPWKIKLRKHAWVPLGRGCSVNCSYCGGGSDAHCLLTGRRTPLFHPKEQIVETLARFEEEHIDSTYMDFDPHPDRRYFNELFDEIRKEKVDISTEFNLWSPSDRSFIRDFARTFNPLYSTLVMSPESGSETVRRKNKGFYYSNEELFRWLEDAKREQVQLEIYFASGLSWETAENFEETIKLAEAILHDYPVVVMICNPIVMEPASPRYLQPDEFGVINLKFGSFIDYYNQHRRLAEGLPVESQLGYETIWQTEQQIIDNSTRFEKVFTSTQPRRWKRLIEGEDVLRFRIPEDDSFNQ
jgi:radical SAM superfamily enzyme YgiQ (UPF0313 family)